MFSKEMLKKLRILSNNIKHSLDHFDLTRDLSDEAGVCLKYRMARDDIARAVRFAKELKQAETTPHMDTLERESYDYKEHRERAAALGNFACTTYQELMIALDARNYPGCFEKRAKEKKRVTQ